MTLNSPIEDYMVNLFGICPSKKQLEALEHWHSLFVEYNSHTNLMGKRDIPYLYSKHVLDSLAISLFEPFLDFKTLLDVGCGGGFPSVILSIFFPELEVFALDSINKKINFLNIVKKELKLDNLQPYCSRAENFNKLNVDCITSRAVGSMSLVWKYSSFHLKKGGYFVSYKALSAEEETKRLIKEYPVFDDEAVFISYDLPVDGKLTRRLVILKVKG